MIDTWRLTFARDPEQAIANLFSGRAGLGSALRLDIPELLYQEFPDRPELAAERARLDLALLHWLLTMRRDYAAQVSRLDYGVYSKRLCDALVAAQLLDLPQTRYQAREALDAWLRWLIPLRLAPERDPALEYWRLLTRRQPDAAHTAAWLRLAADPRPEYLTVALAGLQGLPNGGDARANQVLMLQGLLRHAVAVYATAAEGRGFFNRHFAALRGLQGPFPRAPEHWRQVLCEALYFFAGDQAERKARDLAELLRDGATGRHRADGHRAPVFQPAPLEQRKRLAADIHASTQPPAVLADRLFRILDQNHRYAEATGESHFFVRTLHNLGTDLLGHQALPADALARLGTLIERALVWEPMNPYCWMLWADWLGRQGRWDGREWVLREMLRLFPANAPARVELARTLAQRGEGHWDEAERWLREAAERNPNHAHSRVELARLLIRRGEGHWDEAERWLREAAGRNPNNEPSRVELARLLIRRGEAHWDEAEHWLREVTKRSPTHEHSRVVLAGLLVRRNEAPEAVRLLQDFLAINPSNPIARQFLDRLQAGVDEPWDEGEGLDAMGLKTAPDGGLTGAMAIGGEPLTGNAEPEPDRSAGSSDGFATVDEQATESRALAEVARRGRLASEFTRALIGTGQAAAPTEAIDGATRCGDALAGLYHQWLKPATTPEPPPHAWAWRACRLWQGEAAAQDWQQLEQDCPERRMQTRFLYLLTPLDAAEFEQENRRWRQRYATAQDDASAATTHFMCSRLDGLADSAPASRRDTVLAVLAGAAVGAPEFAPG